MQFITFLNAFLHVCVCGWVLVHATAHLSRKGLHIAFLLQAVTQNIETSNYWEQYKVIFKPLIPCDITYPNQY